MGGSALSLTSISKSFWGMEDRLVVVRHTVVPVSRDDAEFAETAAVGDWTIGCSASDIAARDV